MLEDNTPSVKENPKMLKKGKTASIFLEPIEEEESKADSKKHVIVP